MRTLPLHTMAVATRSRSQLIDVTDEVQRQVSGAQVRQGMVILHVPHTTAGLTINENADPDVQHDLLRKLETMIPQHESYYQHGEGNSDSHLKSSIVGPGLTVLIEDGRLLLGTWQGIYFCEFDGPRRRQLHVKVVDWEG
jgi:secondary thiamine-phosphate synthase enzyme